MTTAADWKSLGYAVAGKFIGVQGVTLTRPPANSPNPLPTSTDEPLVSFQNYKDRAEELGALAANLKRHIDEDGLHLSRQLLTVIPALKGAHFGLQGEVFAALGSAGLSVYLPGNRNIGGPRQKWQDTYPNGFWREGAITVSPVMQANGKEADVVYVARTGHGWVRLQFHRCELQKHDLAASEPARSWTGRAGSTRVRSRHSGCFPCPDPSPCPGQCA